MLRLSHTHIYELILTPICANVALLMVIFGAGASYDSFPSFPPPNPRWKNYRPPLANQLFDQSRFGDQISLFPKCQPIIPFIQGEGVNVERVLEEFQSQASEYPERHRQLAAIRYYLQTMLWVCQQRWKEVTKGVTSYKTLLDQIAHRRVSNGKVCLVTFNYDTLLEDALPTVDVKIQTIPDYISSDYQVVKLHGSINWAHEVTDFHSVAGQNPMATAYELIEKFPELMLQDRFLVANGAPIQSPGSIPYFPALAIPVESKPDYECPAEHLETMEKSIPQVTKVLVIGWRAAENRFLRSLAGGIGRNTRVMVVSSSETRGAEVIERMRGAGVMAKFSAAKGGFSNAVKSREVDNFLKS